MIELELTVIAIHGEGDRDTINALEAHRNGIEVNRLRATNNPISPKLLAAPDEPPDVIVVLRDSAHEVRIELPVKSWQEVEQWKQLAGYDAQKRHWQHGAAVKVRIGD